MMGWVVTQRAWPGIQQGHTPCVILTILGIWEMAIDGASFLCREGSMYRFAKGRGWKHLMMNDVST